MTCSAQSVCKQFLFQEKHNSLKIKLNASKLQKKYSISLSKIKKCRVECSALASEAVGQLDILRMKKVQRMQVFASPELSAEKPLNFAPDFLGNFQDLYLFSSANGV